MKASILGAMVAVCGWAYGAEVPYRLTTTETFDPEKAGWEKVFDDEFDGTRVAWDTKWFNPYFDPQRRDFIDLDGEGHLRVKVDFKDGTTDFTNSQNLCTSSIYTKPGFGYGYYEARFKFTDLPGFWAAFWTYGDVNTNPFVDGFEIDGFEDYYLKKRPQDEYYHGVDHNLHVHYRFCDDGLKSFRITSRYDGSCDEWHTMGIKWTPFEIAYYLDGKLMKGRNSDNHPACEGGRIVWDAFKTCACTDPHNHVSLSCNILTPRSLPSQRDLTGFKPPFYYYVDYVRIYKMPDPGDRAPTVAWTAATRKSNGIVRMGDRMKFAVDVKRAKTGAGIRGAYLFDNGYFLACRTEPPYEFEIPFTDEHYATTQYMAPGRQGYVKKDYQRPKLDYLPHAYHVFVQDEKDQIGRTADYLMRLPQKGASTPYKGVAQTLPGELNPAHFDEGGPDVAYFCHAHRPSQVRLDYAPRPSYKVRANEMISCAATADAIDATITGQWMNYTVDIAEAGAYAVAFDYGTPGRGNNRLTIYVDGDEVGEAKLEPHDGMGFERDRKAKLRVVLPKGRHRLTLLPAGPVSFGMLQFDKLP